MADILTIFAVLVLVVVLVGKLFYERVFGWIAAAVLAILFGNLAATEDSALRWAFLAVAIAQAITAVQLLVRNRRTASDGSNHQPDGAKL
ncbi:MAG TPA: hypothetical protein VFD20_04855 [Demequina sp.]|nr:hypothetical protein [Demequina sp.]